MEKREHARGTALAIIGGVFWGFSGVCGQYLFQEKYLTAKWLVCVRLLIAGGILLFTVYRKQGRNMFLIWKNKKDAVALLLFAIFGMAACQLTYFSAVETSNAGTATVIQYTAPILIMAYTSYIKKRLPTKLEALALIMAVGGTFILATGGDIKTMVLSKEALLWGIGSSIAMALYNLIPTSIMPKYGTFCVVGYGMLIGGILLSLFVHPWNIVGHWDGGTFAALIIVIIIGTLLSFACYMEGVRIIGPEKASLFAAVEPVTATIAVVVFMHVAFGVTDILGLVCIIGAVFLLTKA
ncbi:drug/metabolite transporter (DMT)-like permease [Aequitasia blattaphilus]|uniref:DMT family transporter n=1 Tax=Aequitasia blattaphilus TaxID=2949332 RepID=A0ABT1E7K9_9FIRM|nr:DMT family transporter [Aequitasia blattaphilus]MCP1100836.1 DMT family transporter [Aequitasia blattaphilus]MCR8613476.1 DMT family transporter [Aequitasia blattaphilus]